jgi:hypothetical protein
MPISPAGSQGYFLYPRSEGESAQIQAFFGAKIWGGTFMICPLNEYLEEGVAELTDERLVGELQAAGLIDPGIGAGEPVSVYDGVRVSFYRREYSTIILHELFHGRASFFPLDRRTLLVQHPSGSSYVRDVISSANSRLKKESLSDSLYSPLFFSVEWAVGKVEELAPHPSTTSGSGKWGRPPPPPTRDPINAGAEQERTFILGNVDRHTPNRTIRAALAHFIGGAEHASSSRFFISKSSVTYLAITVEDESRVLAALGKDPFDYQGTHAHDINFVFAAAYVAEEVSYSLGSLDVRDVDAIAPGAILSLPDMAGLTIDDVLMGYNKAAYRIVQKIKGPTGDADDGRGEPAASGDGSNPIPLDQSDPHESEAKYGGDPESEEQLRLLYESKLAADLENIMEDSDAEVSTVGRRSSNARSPSGSPEKPSKKLKNATTEGPKEAPPNDRATASTSSSSSQGSGWSTPARNTRSSSNASLPSLPNDSLLPSFNNYTALSSTDINDTELTETEELLRDQEADLADLQAQRGVREAALRLMEEAELKKIAKKGSGMPLSKGAKEFTPAGRADASPFSSPPASPVKRRDRSRSPNNSASEEEPTSTHASPAKSPPDESTPDQSNRGQSTPDKATKPKSTPAQSIPQAPPKGILQLPSGGLRPKSQRRVQLPSRSDPTPNSTPAGATRSQ